MTTTGNSETADLAMIPMCKCLHTLDIGDY